VKELIAKVTLTGDPALDKARPAGISEIVTKDGKTFRSRVDYPRGHARNPMTDQEVIAKFKDMASVRMKEAQMNRLIESVFALEKLDDIGTLLRLMVFEKSKSSRSRKVSSGPSLPRRRESRRP
jgi:2-methylcitrate dehydratase